MTEFQQTIINNFHNIVKDHEMNCIHNNFTHAQREYDVYSVPYSRIINLFISNLTGLEQSLIGQYVAAQQFFYLISDSPVIDVKVCLHISKHFISIGFKKFVDVEFEFDNQEFLQVRIHSDGIVKFFGYHGDLLLDFETAYNDLLKDINNIVDPAIVSFKQVVELSNKNTFDVLNEKLNHHQINAISPSEFYTIYLNDPAFEYIEETYVNLSEQTFMSFLKENFPSSFNSQLRSILSVSFFQEKLCNRTINWHTLTDLNISFPNVSKYAEFNNIYRLTFCAMPYDDYRCTIDVYDDGTISFCYIKDDVLVELTDLNEIYDYFKEGLINHIEKNLDINRKDITISHLKLYEMVLL